MLMEGTCAKGCAVGPARQQRQAGPMKPYVLMLLIGTIVALSDLVVTEVAPGQANGLPTDQPATTGTPGTDLK
jgi:hypothetical protein